MTFHTPDPPDPQTPSPVTHSVGVRVTRLRRAGDTRPTAALVQAVREELRVERLQRQRDA